jgi:hypothetical protein
MNYKIFKSIIVVVVRREKDDMTDADVAVDQML